MSDSLREGVENIVVGALADQDRFARNNRLPVTPEMAVYLRSGHMPKEPDSRAVTRDIINVLADNMALAAVRWNDASNWVRSQASDRGESE